MARFPRTEPQILVLANNLLAGLTSHEFFKDPDGNANHSRGRLCHKTEAFFVWHSRPRL